MQLSNLFDSPFFINILISAGLGALIGLERAISGKDPSLRTFSLICMGSCIFSMVSRFGAGAGADQTRIAAQIVSGIGFLGAGAIFKSTSRGSGITTATLMWITAAIGMAVGFDLMSLAIESTFAAVFSIYFLQVIHRIIRHLRPSSQKHPTSS